MRRLIVGISGASGSLYAIAALRALRSVADVETHLVLSEQARQTIELAWSETAPAPINKCSARLSVSGYWSSGRRKTSRGHSSRGGRFSSMRTAQRDRVSVNARASGARSN